MSAESLTPDALVAENIRGRYATPARKAHLYLFRLRGDTPTKALIPAPDAVLRAWVDEGTGLRLTPISEALQRCAAAAGIPLHTIPQGGQKQTMARVVVFTAEMPDAETVTVRLVSRAIHYHPKGERIADEVWKQAPDGVWYSVHIPD
ncbi:MAG TPA: hypothetical protein PLD47_14590 [Aggregatilineales bacterium]|nr:hypothetical protein [Anaerolineales bacterium]HRE48952.1 hypothetical protein [Aggregatilineales bacterium]